MVAHSFKQKAKIDFIEKFTVFISLILYKSLLWVGMKCRY